MVDGAGGCHSTSILCHHRDVRRAVVFRQVKLWLVVVHVMCGFICNLSTELISVETRSHILDELWGRKWGIDMTDFSKDKLLFIHTIQQLNMKTLKQCGLLETTFIY